MLSTKLKLLLTADDLLLLWKISIGAHLSMCLARKIF